MAMEKREGVPYAEGIKKVWMKDSRGLIVKASRSCYFLQQQDHFYLKLLNNNTCNISLRMWTIS